MFFFFCIGEDYVKMTNKKIKVVGISVLPLIPTTFDFRNKVGLLDH